MKPSYIVCFAASFSLALSSFAFAADSSKVKLFSTDDIIGPEDSSRPMSMEYPNHRQTLSGDRTSDLPVLSRLANETRPEISNLGYPNIKVEVLLSLAKNINHWLATPESVGAVVTHATSHLEETAYFLNLVTSSEKPVVVVGALRPSPGIGQNASLNVYNAVRIAATPEARGIGVIVLLNDNVDIVRDTLGAEVYQMGIFLDHDLSPLGAADYNRIDFYWRPQQRHTTKSEFDISGLETLPRVDVVQLYGEGDNRLIDAYIAAGAKGIVFTGGGRNAVREAQAKGILFVQSGCHNSGRALENAKASEEKIVTSTRLSPQKARILLRLALTRTTDPKEVQRMFNEY